jgi:hypothetical protein
MGDDLVRAREIPSTVDGGWWSVRLLASLSTVGAPLIKGRAIPVTGCGGL